MNQLDEMAFRKFAKEITPEERELMIKTYQDVADKLKPLSNGKWRKKHKK